MKCEAKTAAHGGWICTSVSHAIFYTFLKSYLSKFTKYYLKKRAWEFQTYLDKIKSSYRLYIFTKINCQTHKKPDKMTSKNYFRKLLNAHPLFTVSLPSSNNLVHFLLTRQYWFLSNTRIYRIGPVIFSLNTFTMVTNVFKAEPNKIWRLKSCKGLGRTNKTAKRTETDVQNSLSWAAMLA